MTDTANSPALRLALLALVAYFCAMAAAHFVGLKLPILFIYFDTPFFAYQDKIISFAVTAYIALFWLAARSRANVPAALIVLGLTVAGLIAVSIAGPPGLAMFVAGLVAAGAVGVVAWSKLGGQTGDVLGASQQLAELQLFVLATLLNDN